MNTSSCKTKIIFGGAGHMGDAFALSMAKNPAYDMVLIARGKFDERTAQYALYPNVKVVHSAADAAQDIARADYFIFAVKPGIQSDALSAEIAPYANPDTVGVSIMAGAKIAYIKAATGFKNVVRAMPNMPCALGVGMTTIYIPNDIAQEKQDEVYAMLSSRDVGITQRVDSEAMVDAGTAISGSGPAYVYLFVKLAAAHLGIPENAVISRMDALIKTPTLSWDGNDKMTKLLIDFRLRMIQGATKIKFDFLDERGFSRVNAQEQVNQTVRGAIAKLKQKNRPSVDELIAQVKSSKGTTQAALEVMDVKGQSIESFFGRIGAGIQAAFDRGQEMGHETLANFHAARKNATPDGFDTNPPLT